MEIKSSLNAQAPQGGAADEARPKLDPVVDNAGTVKKQSFFRRMIAEDVKDAKNHIVNDVVIPTIKDGISGIFHNAVDLIIYGNKRGAGASRSYSSYSKPVGMTASSLSSTTYSPSGRAPAMRSNEVSDTYEYETRYDAERVRDGLMMALEKYPSVSVADLYDLSRITDTDFTNNYWGWTRIDQTNSDIRPGRGGRWLLILPQPEPIKR